MPAAPPLPAWALAPDAVCRVSEAEAYLAQYAPQSEPIALSQAGPSGRSLRLFESVPLAMGAAAGHDGIAFVGGPLWALDWCPSAARSDVDKEDQYLVVSAHPKAHLRNQVDKAVAGPAVLQVWRVPPASAHPPALALAVAHAGALAWDAKWRPGVVADQGVLGVLAAALGDGEVAVYAVPVAGRVPAVPHGTPTTAGPPVVRVPTLARGRCGLASALEWCPRRPHDLLLAACWDGSAVLWRLDAAPPPPPPAVADGAAQRGMNPLLRVQSELSPLRSVAWPPPELRTAYSSAPALRVFACVGHDADLRIWDAADPVAPRLDIPLPREWALGLAWVAAPLGVVVAQDNQRLTFVPLDADGLGRSGPATQSFVLPGEGEVWSVHALPGTAVVSYVTASGDVGVFDVHASSKARSSASHVGVAGWRRGTLGALVAPEGDDLRATACVFGNVDAPKARRGGVAGPPPAPSLPDEGVALHRVRWGGRCGRWRRDAWLAFGGGAGVLRVLRLALDDLG